MTVTEAQPVATCPMRDYVGARAGDPAGTAFHEMDQHRAHAGPVMRTEDAGGYWVFTDHESVSAGLRADDLWSSRVIPGFEEVAQVFIPVMLDGDEHRKWRRVLAAWFTPGRMRAMRDEQRAMAASVIDAVVARGGCDFLADVAKVFPTMVILQLMGMPSDDAPQMLEWVESMVGRGPDGLDGIQSAAMELMGYLAGVIAERRAHPDPEARDVVSAAVGWEIDGAPARDEDILSCLTTLLGAGLDTVAAQSSWTMLHLATHPGQRRRLVAEPELAAHVVEESLRVFPIAQATRTATRDADFQGCPIRRGDNAVFSLTAAGRDPGRYPDAAELDLDRADTRHVSLGHGRHTCLGAHLARQEMTLLLEEWHRRIPDYELVAWPTETAGAVRSVDELRLAW